eukprot:6207690-Pleurochrysis_carterae.AAC.2
MEHIFHISYPASQKVRKSISPNLPALCHRLYDTATHGFYERFVAGLLPIQPRRCCVHLNATHGGAESDRGSG